MRLTLPIISLCAFIFFSFGCSTSKKVLQKPVPVYNITYKVISKHGFKHLGGSYLDKSSHGIYQKDLEQELVAWPIGQVPAGFFASISSTGYEAQDELGSIELQILRNDSIVAQNISTGKNVTLAVTYLVE